MHYFKTNKGKKALKLDSMKRMCLGKKQHRSKSTAELFLPASNSENYNAYKCKYCEYWHIGKSIEK